MSCIQYHWMNQWGTTSKPAGTGGNHRSTGWVLKLPLIIIIIINIISKNKLYSDTNNISPAHQIQDGKSKRNINDVSLPPRTG